MSKTLSSKPFKTRSSFGYFIFSLPSTEFKMTQVVVKLVLLGLVLMIHGSELSSGKQVFKNDTVIN